MAWISEQFKNHRLFRRGLLIFACVLTWLTTHWSFEYAHASSLGGVDIALVITAIQAPVTVLLGYMVKLYTGSADKG